MKRDRCGSRVGRLDKVEEQSRRRQVLVCSAGRGGQDVIGGGQEESRPVPRPVLAARNASGETMQRG